MNQHSLATLEAAEAAEAQLADQAALAALAPQMRRQRDADRLAAERGQAVSITHGVLRDEIRIAIPGIRLWNSFFMPWVAGDVPPEKSGLALVFWMKEIQEPLWAAFVAHVGAIRAQQGRAHNAEQAGVIHGQTERAVYASLEGLGAFSDDLEPYPQAGNGWSADLVALVARAVGRCYFPSRGADQFRQGR